MTLTVPSSLATSELPATDDPGRRGVLLIRHRAAQHLVEGVLARAAAHVAGSDARVTSLADDGVELDLSVTLEYPTVPLSGVLRDLRRTLADEAGRQLGRPVRHIDLTVSEFVTRTDATRNASRRVI